MGTHDMMIENKFFKDVNPLICGWEECESNHSFGPSERNYWLLHYVQSGKGTLKKNGHAYPVHAGEIFVIKPNETTIYTADAKEPWNYIWIGFECNLHIPDSIQSPVIQAEACQHIFRTFKFYTNTGKCDELLLCSKIYELLSILSCSQSKIKNSSKIYVNRAKNYIRTNYMNDITVTHIASQLGLDRSYFCRIFKKEEGIPPSFYISNMRLSHAAELLNEKIYTIKEVAFQCGYNDLVTFSRMFKRYYKVAPSQYIIS